MRRSSQKPYLLVEGKRVEGIAFDLEGTLVDIEFLHWEKHLAIAKLLGLKDLTLNFEDESQNPFLKIPHFVGGPDEAVIDDIINLVPHLPQEFAILSETELRSRLREEEDVYFRTRFDNLHPSEIHVREGALEFIQQLREKKLSISIGSLTERDKATKLLALSGLDRFFDPSTIVLKEDVTKTKPEPDVYQETAKRMGISTENQLVFEDSHNGIRAAVAAGSLAIGVPTVNQPEVMRRLREAGAIRIFDNSQTAWKEAQELLRPEWKRAIEGGVHFIRTRLKL